MPFQIDNTKFIFAIFAVDVSVHTKYFSAIQYYSWQFIIRVRIVLMSRILNLFHSWPRDFALTFPFLSLSLFVFLNLFALSISLWLCVSVKLWNDSHYKMLFRFDFGVFMSYVLYFTCVYTNIYVHIRFYSYGFACVCVCLCVCVRCRCRSCVFLELSALALYNNFYLFVHSLIRWFVRSLVDSFVRFVLFV